MSKLVPLLALTLVLSSFVLINLVECGPSDAESRPEDWWWWWHDQFNQTTANNPNIPIIFYGDSITQGWMEEGKDLFDEYYGSLGAVNYAIGGDRTEHVLWRILDGEIRGLNPKLVVLMIGINNVFDGLHDNVATAGGVTTVVETLRRMLPNTKILLLGLMPCCGTWGYENIVEINEIIKNLHNGSNVFYLDMMGSFSHGWGDMIQEYFTDGVHLSQQGYQKWADTMNPIFNQLIN